MIMLDQTPMVFHPFLGGYQLSMQSELLIFMPPLPVSDDVTLPDIFSS